MAIIYPHSVLRNKIELCLASFLKQLHENEHNKRESVEELVRTLYQLFFGVLAPVLQAVFNLSVLHEREHDRCQLIMCAIAGATVRLYGYGWQVSLPDILEPGLREFTLDLGPAGKKRWQSGDRFELAVCFVWAALIRSAAANKVKARTLAKWAVIHRGLWTRHRSECVNRDVIDPAATEVVSSSPHTIILARQPRTIKRPNSRHEPP
jgi:hypothetical protein